MNIEFQAILTLEAAFKAVESDGKPLPTFEDLGEDRQQCWVAATDAMVE